MRRPFSSQGQRLVRLICLVAVAFVTVFHVHAASASTRLQAAVTVALDEHGDRDDAGKAAGETCHLCSCCPVFVATPVALPAATVRHTPPTPRVQPLVAFRLQATAPPPRS